jgi:hypothetical protein
MGVRLQLGHGSGRKVQGKGAQNQAPEGKIHKKWRFAGAYSKFNAKNSI